jgi:hypothetical protein
MSQDLPSRQEEFLYGQGQLREHIFSSTIPVIGGLIARFRAAWNNVSTRWYVLPLADQQSVFNQALLDYVLPRLSNYDRRLGHVEEHLPRLDEMDARILAHDQRQVDLTHDAGEMVARLVQISRRLELIETRLAALELQPNERVSEQGRQSTGRRPDKVEGGHSQ